MELAVMVVEVVEHDMEAAELPEVKLVEMLLVMVTMVQIASLEDQVVEAEAFTEAKMMLQTTALDQEDLDILAE